MMTEEELERACTAEERAIEAMPDGPEKTERSLALADTYIDNDMDNGALRILEQLADKTYHKEGIDEEQSQRVLSALMRLGRTDNDYVSERCSTLIGWLM